jgi:hypothetical protein
VGLLGVVVAVLVFFALRPPEPPTSVVVTDTPTSTADPTATPDPTPTASESAEATPTEEPPQAAGPARERPLDVLSSTVAVRAVPGACPGGGGVIETTTNGGGTWNGVDTPADEVLRATWASTDNLWFVGAGGESCSPAFFTSGDEGGSWGGPEDAAAAWHLLPEPTASQLHAPNGNVSSPCGGATTLELEPISTDQAFVLCGTGEVFETRDAGGSWGSLGTAEGAVALGVADGSPLVAVPTTNETCEGLGIGAVAAEGIGCADGAPDEDVALSFADGGVGFLLAGAETHVTADGGASWQQVS